MSILMRSPSEMNAGTCTMRPVSILAGLPTFETEPPLMDGSVSMTVMSTVCGSSMPTGRSSYISILSLMLGMRYGTASPRISSERPICSKLSLFMKWYMLPSW